MKQVLIRFALVFLMMVGIIGIFSWRHILMSFSTPTDIYENYPEDFTKVKAVETELGMLLGIFCEETTTTTKNGAVTGTNYDYYYIVPVFSSTDTETYYVGVKVDSDKSRPYDKIMNATWSFLNYESDYIEAEPIAFQGGLFKMEDDLYKYFEDWFVEAEYFENEADMNKYLLPYVLEPFSYKTMRITAFVSGGFILLGILFLFLALKSGKKQTGPTKAAITINGTNYPATNFIKVNAFVEKGKTDKAIAELQKVINVDSSTAAFIIGSWNQYWG